MSHEETEINDSDVVELNYTYDDNNRVASATFAFATPILQDFEYDVLNRVTHQELKQDKLTICHEYSYLQQDENTIDLVSEDINKIKVTTNGETTYMIETNSYTYDVCGNIISIETDESTTRYKYDKLNRLIREDNPLLDKSIVYKYDKSGNVVSKKTYSYTLDDKLYSASVIDEYTYSCDGWKDQLIDYNGKSFVYDNMGRPTTYMDNELEWNKKGELTYALTKDKEIEYFYDAQSIRRKKIVDGVETKHITDGSKILEIISTDENGNQLYKIIYRYALDKLVGFCYSNNGISKEYIYDRNIFEDITSIYDSEGVIIAKYVYDAYGKVTVLNSQGEPDSNINSIGNINPFRYRGYYFDSETGFYYLNSRYYDPETGRFISPDILTILDETKGQINGLNLYMYCGDNPVYNYDSTGYFTLPNWAKWIIGGVAFIGAVALICLTGGALAPVFIGMAGSILLDGIIEGSISYATGGSFWDGFADGAANGAMWGGIFALGGAILRTIKMFKNGVAIGENMKRINNLATAGHQITYNGMPGYNFVKMFGGNDLARTLSMKHNQAFIERMMKWGIKIVDFGIDTSRNYRSFYYLMETIVSNGYRLLQLMY